MNDLIGTIRELAASRISAGVQAFGATGILVWLGDDVAGIEAQRDFHINDVQAAAQWLHDIACECYPGSEYALDQAAWPPKPRPAHQHAA